MERRKFLIGVGGTAIGGSALVGSGAFSRVESQRDVTIQVAEDPDAYLGITPLDGVDGRDRTPNGANYTGLDEKGHAYLHIGDSTNDGYGVNSDSHTYFDGLFKICNQGKERADFKLDGTELEALDNVDVWFYTSYDPEANTGPGDGDDHWQDKLQIVDDGDGVESASVSMGVGNCTYVGLKVKTKSVDATDSSLNDDSEEGEGNILVRGEVKMIADSPEAGEIEE